MVQLLNPHITWVLPKNGCRSVTFFLKLLQIRCFRFVSSQGHNCTLILTEGDSAKVRMEKYGEGTVA